jgi:membrane associated rhomboid family serine protease
VKSGRQACRVQLRILALLTGINVAAGPPQGENQEGEKAMFPIGDDNSGERSFPVVTYALIALNVLFFLVELNGGDSFIQQWSLVPRRFLANPAGDFPTIFTSMFMHAGWIHLLGNMLYLWIFRR